MNMSVKTPLFEASPLDIARLTDAARQQFDIFYRALHAKIGQVLRTQRRLYRVPSNDERQSDHLYALLVLSGQKSDGMIEVVCSASICAARWPNVSDIERGKRLRIEVVDWIDAILLMSHLETYLAKG